ARRAAGLAAWRDRLRAGGPWHRQLGIALRALASIPKFQVWRRMILDDSLNSMEQRWSIRVLGFHAVVLPLVTPLQPLELALLVREILAADILLQVGLSGRRLLR